MLRKMSKTFAKALMNFGPVYPSPDDLSLNEIFRHARYTEASATEQDRIKDRSAMFRYEYEQQHGYFDQYFPDIPTGEFRDKKILDLGSFTGGRLIAWMERYGFGEGRGLDIDPLFADAGNSLAQKKGVNASFDTGFGEDLPYASDSFDIIASYDVFEHVQDVEAVMRECHRVLKPGGSLLTVFPPFFQPLESHLGLVTKVPALHWIFSGETITEAYDEILAERGKEAYWYARKRAGLEAWEKLPTLNGITVSRFRRIVAENPQWNVRYWGRDPLLSDGRRAHLFVFRVLRKCFVIPARTPLLEELFLGRICCMLQKTSREAA